MLTNEQFTACAQRYIDTVYRVAFNYIKSAADAEDVTQNVFLKLLKADKPFASGEHVKSWLIRVTLNECKNLVRARWWRHESYEDYAASLTFDTPAHSDLFYAVMALPRRYRVPIYLHYYEEYTTQEIAELLKVSKNTVCTQLRRGRELLRESLTEVETDV
ncbi:MAG: sigma-70 family RNA polymerase sigma factor [Christensenellales bacterium]|nr:sigma-70 family RNA polymerase sigma factor [Christensenellales bacterium]